LEAKIKHLNQKNRNNDIVAKKNKIDENNSTIHITKGNVQNELNLLITEKSRRR